MINDDDLFALNARVEPLMLLSGVCSRNIIKLDDELQRNSLVPIAKIVHDKLYPTLNIH